MTSTPSTTASWRGGTRRASSPAPWPRWCSAWLGVRIGRPGIGRLSGAGAVAWAAAGGAVLAMVNAGVAFLAGGPKHLSVVWAGDLYEVDLFQADGPWRVVVVWAALFPVAAVAGAALSALATRRP